MKIECPSCLYVTKLKEDLFLSRSKGLHVKCPKCESLIKLYLLARSEKNAPLETATDPFGDEFQHLNASVNDPEK